MKLDEKIVASDDDRRHARAILEPLTDRQRRALYAVVIEQWQAAAEDSP